MFTKSTIATALLTTSVLIACGEPAGFGVPLSSEAALASEPESPSDDADAGEMPDNYYPEDYYSEEDGSSEEDVSGEAEDGEYEFELEFVVDELAEAERTLYLVAMWFPHREPEYFNPQVPLDSAAQSGEPFVVQFDERPENPNELATIHTRASYDPQLGEVVGPFENMEGLFSFAELQVTHDSDLEPGLPTFDDYEPTGAGSMPYELVWVEGLNATARDFLAYEYQIDNPESLVDGFNLLHRTCGDINPTLEVVAPVTIEIGDENTRFCDE